MKITVVGTGYVGLVTGVCLASLGHDIIGVNRNRVTSAALNKGHVPFYEPGLRALLKKVLARKKIRFSTDLGPSVQQSDVVMIAVGTPSRADGSADLSQVEAVARQIGRAMKRYTVVANKSTVPVGTANKIRAIVRKHYHGQFDVMSIPEFLREGSALRDFLKSDRVVIGTDSDRAQKVGLQIFKKIKAPKVLTTLETAEMIKYASNAFLSTKISFINEIANVCDRVGADVDEVARGMGFDPRIGSAFLKAGIGYGGSCFPKDVRALKSIAGTHGYNFHLLRAVIDVNNNQRKIFIEKIRTTLKTLKGKRLAVLGLAFKGNTDDVRESAAIELIRLLQKAGVRVTAYDPMATANAQAILDGSVFYASSAYEAVRGADAVIVATEWPQFKRLDWKKVKRQAKRAIVFDGKNLLDRKVMELRGFKYVAIGK